MLVAWIRDRKADIQQVITAARSEPGPTSSPEWFAGLAVSPASFSRQLSDMQLSLMRANEMHRQTQGRTEAGGAFGVSQQRV